MLVHKSKIAHEDEVFLQEAKAAFSKVLEREFRRKDLKKKRLAAKPTAEEVTKKENEQTIKKASAKRPTKAGGIESKNKVSYKHPVQKGSALKGFTAALERFTL